jgi:uncharacterized membrane protein YccC
VFKIKSPQFHFRLTESVADALRNTVIVLLPVVLLYQHYRQVGIGIGVGALLISLTDLPGNRRNKAVTALLSFAIFFLVSMIFSASLSSPILTGLVLLILTFLLSMTAALGGRSAAAGTMGIVLMVFTLGLRPKDPLLFSAFIVAGGAWFHAVSLVQVLILPFRSLYQALREALSATADFLDAKAACYDPAVPLDEAYRKTIALHLRVSEKQELVRQLLLSDRPNARHLLNTAIRVISLYEQVTAMHYDYAIVRERLAQTGALPLTAELITLLSEETRQLSRIVPVRRSLNKAPNDARYSRLTGELSAMAGGLEKEDAAVINGILVNTAAIRNLLAEITTDEQAAIEDLPEPGAFLPNELGFPSKLRAHFSLRSPVLRFSLRLTLLFAVGYMATLFFAPNQYSYWLLLTIVIVARPKLALTWQRNLERLSGTAVGVLLASLLLFLVKAAVVLLVIAAVGLLCFFAWNRSAYARSVTGITVCVVICLSLYHGQPATIMSARLWYSLAGCVLAFAGIFIFPVWINTELDELAHAAIEGNLLFLEAVAAEATLQEVRLARKEAHLRLARLSEGLRHARVEPGKADLPRLEQVQVLNYRINAVIISLFLAGRRPEQQQLERTMGYMRNFIRGGKQVQDLPEALHEQHLLKGTALLEALSLELIKLPGVKLLKF